MIVALKLILDYFKEKSQIQPAEKDKGPIRKLQKKRIRIMWSFFAASFVHVCCLLPGAIIFGLNLDFKYPQLALFSRPLMMLGYTLCPVRSQGLSKLNMFDYIGRVMCFCR